MRILPRTGGREKDMLEKLLTTIKNRIAAIKQAYARHYEKGQGRFKPETIEKVMNKALQLVDYYCSIPADLIRLTISRGNRKIGRVMNVSTMPGIACGNCIHCLGYCYDIKACAYYVTTVIDARVRNYVLAMYHRDVFFDRIDKACSRRRTNKYFRWHVAGDILDYDYFCRMIEIARKHPDFTFWTYTKMYHIVNHWIALNGPLPENIHIMFSVWDGVPTPNPYNMPVFVCRLKDGNKDMTDAEIYSLYHCPGNCDVCKAAGRGCCSGESAYADEH